MISHAVMVLPWVKAPGLDEAFLPTPVWSSLAPAHLVRIEDGAPAVLTTDLRVAWSDRGIHACFTCTDPDPLHGEFAWQAPIEEEEAVAVFLDPVGERSQYVAILASPYGRVGDARVESPLHHLLGREVDESWQCEGVRVRSTSEHGQWTVELLIPFSGITPVIESPTSGDRWTGNFYRIEHHPPAEITAWQPTFHSPPDLYATDHFGILEFGAPLMASDER